MDCDRYNFPTMNEKALEHWEHFLRRYPQKEDDHIKEQATAQPYVESSMVMASILLTTDYLHQWAAKFRAIIPDLDHAEKIVEQLGVPLS